MTLSSWSPPAFPDCGACLCRFLWFVLPCGRLHGEERSVAPVVVLSFLFPCLPVSVIIRSGGWRAIGRSLQPGTGLRNLSQKELKGLVLCLNQMNGQNRTVNWWWNYHLQSTCLFGVEALWNVRKIWNYLSVMNSHLWRCQKSSHDSSFEWVSRTYWQTVMHYLLLDPRSLNRVFCLCSFLSLFSFPATSFIPFLFSCAARGINPSSHMSVQKQGFMCHVFSKICSYFSTL